MKKKEKTISLKTLILVSIVVFIANYISSLFIHSKVKIWFIFLVLLTISLFEILFFYKSSKKTFKPLSFNDGVICVLFSIGSTVVVIGTILFIISLIY